MVRRVVEPSLFMSPANPQDPTFKAALPPIHNGMMIDEPPGWKAFKAKDQWYDEPIRLRLINRYVVISLGLILYLRT